MRKIIQIAIEAGNSDDDIPASVWCLCDDGTLWESWQDIDKRAWVYRGKVHAEEFPELDK